jgi:hypothetical protein
MEIRIVNNEQEIVLEGKYEYAEGKSRQEGRPSFFISTDNFVVDFLADKSIEIDKLIANLIDIRKNFDQNLS